MSITKESLNQSCLPQESEVTKESINGTGTSGNLSNSQMINAQSNSVLNLKSNPDPKNSGISEQKNSKSDLQKKLKPCNCEKRYRFV